MKQRKAISITTITSLRRAAVALAGVTVLTIGGYALSSASALAEEANLFSWGGYDMEGFHEAYVEEHGSMPGVSFFTDEDTAFAKIRAGYTPDVTAICSYEIPRWRDAGLLQPIDESRLSNFPELIDSLKNVPGSVVDGERWWVPLDWGNTSVTYRTDLVDMEEESWGLLWDERYAGRLSMWDSITDGMAIAPIYMGIDPYDMSPEEVAAVREKLLEQRPLLKYYSGDKTSISQALASGELVAAVTATDSYTQLKSDGLPVAFLQPKEGILTWVCGLVLMKDAPDVDKAYDLMNSMISKEAGVAEMSAFGFGHANAEAFGLMTDEELEAVGLPRDPDALLSNGVLQQAFANRDELVDMYDQVMAGF